VELFTLDRGFHAQNVIDRFLSAIWTERYYGDSEVELVVPPTKEMFQKLQIGTFLGLVGSKEIMILETHDTSKGDLKVTGISLSQWLNNRFIRATAAHEDRYWYVSGVPGQILTWIVSNWCIAGSAYLSGAVNMGIPNPASLAIPGLTIKGTDQSGSVVNIAVPFGPVYDALREIATTYQIGMQITLESVSDTSYSIQFRNYKGLDRTTAQTANPSVRFSPHMDSLTGI
jgi:hypothetical protein